jgi:putative heme-binding domain-containing protein
MFAKTCQQCHTMFGTGGKVGPELTGSNRANLDYLLSNILDPSAVMAKEYMPSVIALADGRVITGIVKSKVGGVLTVQAANEVLLVPEKEIDEMQQSAKSMMPDDILKPLKPEEIRALVAYMASPAQVPLLATEDTVKNFFNGRDLTGWDGRGDLWSVENGEIVGRSAGLKNNEFLISQLSAANFKLSLEVKLVGNAGNSGIQFRSEVLPHKGLEQAEAALRGPEMKGYQADIGAGWWGKLYEENGRALLWKDSGEAHVKPGEWNTYEVEAIGSRIKTWINGRLCVDLEDTGGPRRGVFGLQLHSGGPTEVRYRKIKLEVR